MPRQIEIGGGEDRRVALHWEGQGWDLASATGRPCVVMAHGFASTVDCGLPAFAERLAAAGADVIAFDYRHFGESAGEPRQLLSPARQRQDYHAAIAYARSLEDVDAGRIIAWGVSFSGGHVFQVAAEDGRLGGVIALTPAPDNRISLLNILRNEGPIHGLKLTAVGLRDLVGGALGRPPITTAAVGEPGSIAALTAPGALEGMNRIAGPDYRNEVCARIYAIVGSYRPGVHAKKLTCPVLVQVVDGDTTAPPRAIDLVVRPGTEVRHYPGDHFDVYPGGGCFERAAEHQVRFVTRHFASERAPVAAQ